MRYLKLTADGITIEMCEEGCKTSSLWKRVARQVGMVIEEATESEFTAWNNRSNIPTQNSHPTQGELF